MKTKSASPTLNLTTPGGALAFVLSVRLVFGLWALPISARFPETQIEKHLALWPPGVPLSDWLYRIVVAPWIRYDAIHYSLIMRNGYDLQLGESAFHPLFPLLAWPFFKLGLPSAGALLFVSTASAFALTLILARYVAKFHDAKHAFGPSLFLLGGLCGFLLLAPYNESLFLALAVGCIWAARDERFWLAGLLGAFAAFTRQQGLALLLPLCWQIAVSQRANRLDFFAPCLIFCGYAAFVFYRFFVLRDTDFSKVHTPLEAVRVFLVSPASQNMVHGQHLALPWQTIAAQWQRLMATGNGYYLAIDLFLGCAMCVLALVGWKKMHVTERLYSLTIVLLALCYYNGWEQPLLSLPRHAMLAFPLYITLSRWASATPARFRIALEFACVINLFLSAAYFRNGWVP